MLLVHKILGLSFVVMAFFAEYFLIVYILSGTLVKDPASNQIFAATVIPVSIPIMVGLALFGWYAFKGEYIGKMKGARSEINKF